ncbi:hypothetical protein GW755_01910 [bacterium]|nr:hypothetical protein [bacterium]
MKYLFWIFILLVSLTLFRAIYPTVKVANACMYEFEKNSPSRLILTRSGNSESTKNFCVKNLSNIKKVKTCLESSKKEEKIKGITELIKKIDEIATLSGEEISNNVIEHNRDCENFPELLFREQ